MQLVSVANVSFSCPGLQLNIRDGVRPQDTLLYTLREDTRVTVAVRSSRHVARLELVADTRDLNTSHCYAVMHVSVLIEGEHTDTTHSCLNTHSAAQTTHSCLNTHSAACATQSCLNTHSAACTTHSCGRVTKVDKWRAIITLLCCTPSSTHACMHTITS